MEHIIYLSINQLLMCPFYALLQERKEAGTLPIDLKGWFISFLVIPSSTSPGQALK